jgi:hypothetical protein
MSQREAGQEDPSALAAGDAFMGISILAINIFLVFIF